MAVDNDSHSGVGSNPNVDPIEQWLRPSGSSETGTGPVYHHIPSTCPRCGYCPTCGRGWYIKEWWYPQYPYTPYMPVLTGSDPEPGITSSFSLEGHHEAVGFVPYPNW